MIGIVAMALLRAMVVSRSLLTILVGMMLALSALSGQVAADQAPAEDFGVRLARAASTQRWVPTLYAPSYQKIPYPGGDVSMFIGVCTDVVVRAYRALGIDLQVKVHEARVGSGDTNIDHRRVVVLKKFFAGHGVSLPISKNPADYKPGDLVTYYLPDGTFSKTHIAIVAEEKNSDGVPMVIHNRGYSVQLEDWLFGSKITGHYRYPG